MIQKLVLLGSGTTKDIMETIFSQEKIYSDYLVVMFLLLPIFVVPYACMADTAVIIFRYIYIYNL